MHCPNARNLKLKKKGGGVGQGGRQYGNTKASFECGGENLKSDFEMVPFLSGRHTNAPSDEITPKKALTFSALTFPQRPSGVVGQRQLNQPPFNQNTPECVATFSVASKSSFLNIYELGCSVLDTHCM